MTSRNKLVPGKCDAHLYDAAFAADNEWLYNKLR